MASQVHELENEVIIYPKKEDAAPPEVKAEPEPKPKGDKRRKLVGQIQAHPLLAVLAVTVLVIGAASLWLYLSSYEQTDDAQVDGHLHPISARISGTVLSVNPDAQNNHYVQ